MQGLLFTIEFSNRNFFTNKVDSKASLESDLMVLFHNLD